MKKTIQQRSSHVTELFSGNGAQRKSQPKGSRGALLGCLFIIIYWAVTFIAANALKEDYILWIMTAVFFISLLILILSGKISHNPQNLTFLQDLERTRFGGGSGSDGGSDGGGGGCGGGGCGG